MMIKRLNRCRNCESYKLKPVLCLKDMPFTDQFICESSIGKEFLEDIHIHICESCGIVQNVNDINMDEYYRNYTYSVGRSNFANLFMKTLAEKLYKEYFRNYKRVPFVLEIGSGTGDLLKCFKEMRFQILGIEPSKYLSDIANAKGVHTINSFFDEKIIHLIPEKFRKVDLLISCFTFDHIPYLHKQMQTIRELLDIDGLLVIEVHDLDIILERNEFCLFAHEHFFYFNKRTMTQFLFQNGFRVITYKLLSNEKKRANSLLVVAKKTEKQQLKYELDIKKELKILYNLEKNILKSIKKIDNFLFLNKDKKIVAYGAGGRGVMTLAALNNYSYFNYIVDKNPRGKNLFTPKSHLRLFGIDELSTNRADIIVVFSYGYYNEIVNELTQKYGYKSKQFISLLELL